MALRHPSNERYAGWLRETIASELAYGVSELVLSRFLGIVTHPRGMTTPAPMESALAFAEALRSQPNALPLACGPRRWAIFERLCRDSGVRGNLVPNAYLAALAIEHGAELVTADRDFARFPGLRWRTPF
ncbi:MAG: type II toxin-antitoxin system VapC family toxin [Conexibacter sp.]